MKTEQTAVWTQRLPASLLDEIRKRAEQDERTVTQTVVRLLRIGLAAKK